MLCSSAIFVELWNPSCCQESCCKHNECTFDVLVSLSFTCWLLSRASERWLIKPCTRRIEHIIIKTMAEKMITWFMKN